MSRECQRHNDIDTDLPMPLEARRLPLQCQHCLLFVREAIKIDMSVGPNGRGWKRSLGGLFLGSVSPTGVVISSAADS
jgi:hypothetical protein